MNILYIAYSCLPDSGSENKIGWNIPIESSKSNNVFVVTKEEHREAIEAYLKKHLIQNIRFFFVDIPNVYKRVFKGVTYSIRLNFWHRRAFPIVKSICEKENIDIIHQITPVEFRSIGNYADIENTKFVCGPLGGGEFLPRGLRSYAKGNMSIEYARAIMNKLYSIKYKFNKKLVKCDYILFANKETSEYLSDLMRDVSYNVYSEIGISEDDIIKTPHTNNRFTILVAGRLVYRKGHSFLLDALKKLPKDVDYMCRFVGQGSKKDYLETKVKKLGLEDKVVFVGRIPFEDLSKEYEKADVFVMPSLRETTGSVLLESMSKSIPVITINKFGGAILLDENSGWFYSGNAREDYVNGLCDAILECMSDVCEVQRRGDNAKEIAKKYLWSKKVEYYNSIYNQLLQDKN